MKTKNTDNIGKFILGTLFGGLVGGVAALLMTPRSGEETQKILLEKRNQFQQDAEKRIDEGRSFAEEEIIDTRNVVAEWFSSGSNLLDEKSRELKIEKSSKPKKDKPEQVSAASS
jgi:gas vesicle protein